MGLPVAFLALIGAVMIPGLVRSVQAQIELERALSQAKAPVTEPPGPADRDPPADQGKVKADVLAWLADGGRAHIRVIGHDLTTLGDSPAEGDAAMGRVCATMTAHLEAAHRFRPFPDQAGQDAWTEMMTHFALASATCPRPGVYLDKDMAARWRQELRTAAAALDQFNRRLERLTGQRPKTSVARA